MTDSKELIALLSLKDIGENSFKGHSVSVGSPHVFGGQVLAQAINAAYRTVSESRFLHSLHSYFLEIGDLEIPILYQVQVIRDGGSFSTRRVTASQNNKIIFILAASFHKVEAGFTHQEMFDTDIPKPENLLSWTDIIAQFENQLPRALKSFLSIERPIEFKPTFIQNPLQPKNLPAKEHVWFRLKGDHSKLSIQIKHQILTYISDYNILNAAFNPHASKYNFNNTQTASLDHSMWFFRDFEFDDWLLMSAESPSASGARGYTRGNIYTRDGQLIASFAQEGLMRLKNN